MANTIRINVRDNEPLKLGFENDITLKYVGADHTKLDNLDYEHSGHTGFMPAKLSILPEVGKDIPNNKLRLSVFNPDTEITSQIAFNDLKDRIIKTGSAEELASLEKGQYYFQEIIKEGN